MLRYDEVVTVQIFLSFVPGDHGVGAHLSQLFANGEFREPTKNCREGTICVILSTSRKDACSDIIFLMIHPSTTPYL